MTNLKKKIQVAFLNQILISVSLILECNKKVYTDIQGKRTALGKVLPEHLTKLKSEYTNAGEILTCSLECVLLWFSMRVLDALYFAQVKVNKVLE